MICFLWLHLKLIPLTTLMVLRPLSNLFWNLHACTKTSADTDEYFTTNFKLRAIKTWELNLPPARHNFTIRWHVTAPQPLQQLWLNGVLLLRCIKPSSSPDSCLAFSRYIYRKVYFTTTFDRCSIFDAGHWSDWQYGRRHGSTALGDRLMSCKFSQELSWSSGVRKKSAEQHKSRRLMELLMEANFVIAWSSETWAIRL